ncbi:MAG: hypothetical protein NZM12_06505 [Steroidobacteraceae bacterium]|nr:hypothetical protein [Steroidobacteraceae bacterium]MDW8257895.1 hypothetical protein [Gammaproteobacteria bacterium]
MNRLLRIGARRSPLARQQALLVGAALRAVDPNLRIAYQFIETRGDRSPDPDAARVTARGGFTEDLALLLECGAIDLAVHSWKDLPLAERATTTVAATLPRADPRDALLIRRAALAHIATRGLRVLSSAARRRIHLEEFLAWALPVPPVAVEFAPVRGDIETRLTRLLSGEGDALVIAKAAIDRLLADPPAAGAGDASTYVALERARACVARTLAACRVLILPLSVCPAAPAQGALAIETRRRDAGDPRLVAINCAATFATVTAERQLAARIGEQEPLGVTRLRFDFGDVEFVRGASTEFAQPQIALYRRGAGLPRPLHADLIFSPNPDQPARLREELPDAPRHFAREQGLLVARAEALPPGTTVDEDTVIWTAGLATWRKLAARGYWVVGSDDSLGDPGAAGVRAWFPAATDWVKLTHTKGHPQPHARCIATYRSVPRLDSVAIHRYSHFYWHSGSQLREQLRVYPGLAQAWHGCGPGNTYAIARGLLDERHVKPFLSATQFYGELLR